MRQRAIALAGAVTVMATAPAAEAHSLNAKYLSLYHHVRHELGKRAPGRNIVHDGVRTRHGERRARAREVARSIHTLRRMLAPPAAAPVTVAAPAIASRPAAGLDAIARCESGGNPRAVDPTGTYRGKYQFDTGTWRSVGGTGDPAAAPEAEQDRRAAMLMAQRGNAPWPTCGR